MTQPTRILAALAIAAAAVTASPAQDESAALANGLYSRGLFDMAAAEYSALLAADPAREGSDTLSFRLGECYRRTGRAAEALKAYQAAADAAPNSPDGLRARLQLGLAELESGKAAEAAPRLQALAADATDQPELRAAALFYAGEAFNAAGQPATAATLYDIVRQVAADQSTIDYATLRLASIKAAAGDDAGAASAQGLFRAIVDRPAPPEIAAEALFQLAQLAESRQKPEEAAACYLELFEKYPATPHAAASRLRAAWACFEAGRYADTRRFATEALAEGKPETSPEALYLRANAERQLELRTEAIDDYATLLKDFPGYKFAPAARYERILTLYRDTRYADAIADGDKFADPPADLRDDLLWLLAEAAAAIPDQAGAVQRYRMLLRQEPDSPFAPQALYRLAYLLQEQKAFAEASASYLDFCARFPDHELAPAALFASGACLSSAGRGDEAIRDWQELVKRFPNDERVPEALYQRAIEDIRAKRNSEAAESLDALLERFPAFARRNDALFWRGMIFHDAGDDAEAQRLLRDLLAAKPSRDLEREAMFLLGMIAHSQGRTDEAAALLQPLLETAARGNFPPERLEWLATFQFDRGDFASSKAAAQALLDNTADPVWKQAALVLLARAGRASGDAPAAIDWLRLALALGVNSKYAPEAALRLGELLLDAGQIDDATSALNDAANRAATAAFIDVRARATAGLARAAEARGDKDAAVRYHFAVAILYDDAELVPYSLDRAAVLLAELGRAEESAKAAGELVERYPDSAQAKAWAARMAAEPAATAAPAGDTGEAAQ